MKIKKIVIAAAIGATVFATAACGSDTASNVTSSAGAAVTSATSAMAPSSDMESSPMESSSGMESSPMESSSGMESSDGMTSGSDDPAANLVGAGCAAYAEANPDGAGSVGGMATANVVAAASANPLLKTLVSAVGGELNPDVNLVDTLSSGEWTVFAPVDEAFAKVPAATIETLKTDKDALEGLLTYHVIEGQLSPADIVGTHKTVQGDEVTVSGSGDNLKVNDSTVICGGVKTANATVYLIDTVLSPPAS